VGFSTELAKVLPRRPSLDALAAAVIMVRIAHLEDEAFVTHLWGRLALRVALLQVELLYAGGIFRPLIELLDERVLTLASHGGTRPSFPEHGCGGRRDIGKASDRQPAQHQPGKLPSAATRYKWSHLWQSGHR
jgi:hypothetical protein